MNLAQDIIGLMQVIQTSHRYMCVTKKLRSTGPRMGQAKIKIATRQLYCFPSR
jgi:hypothetical protein